MFQKSRPIFKRLDDKMPLKLFIDERLKRNWYQTKAENLSFLLMPLIQLYLSYKRGRRSIESINPKKWIQTYETPGTFEKLSYFSFRGLKN